jgi:hypothetical protein
MDLDDQDELDEDLWIAGDHRPLSFRLFIVFRTRLYFS